jgi:hypothetical protein
LLDDVGFVRRRDIEEQHERAAGRVGEALEADRGEADELRWDVTRFRGRVALDELGVLGAGEWSPRNSILIVASGLKSFSVGQPLTLWMSQTLLCAVQSSAPKGMLEWRSEASSKCGAMSLQCGQLGE